MANLALPITLLFAIILSTISSAVAETTNKAGAVVAVRGVVTAQSDSGTPRVLGRDGDVATGEVITTSERSFAVLRLKDGTRMSLRPNTSFKVSTWNEEPQKESAVFRLFKGGLRAISGALAKRNPRAFRLQTSVATIGIRGTTFDVRLCEGGCKDDAEKYKEVPAKISAVVGRVGYIKGDVSAVRNEAGLERQLTIGAPIYEGDTVKTKTASFTVLLFKDKSRVTLRANSEFVIASLKYKKTEEDTAIFRLVRGGLRAVTGLIGKRRPASVKYRTAIATIGIRGTGFDMYCQGTCESEQSKVSGLIEIRHKLSEMLIPNAYAVDADKPGLIVSPWENSVIVERPQGSIVVEQGKIMLIPADGSEPIFLVALPGNIEEPRPEDVEIDEDLLLAFTDPDVSETGLYLACQEGHCLMGEVPLGEGEAAFKGEGANAKPVRFELIPQFLTEDPYFKTVDIDPEVFDVFGAINDPTALECTVQ